LRNFHLKAAAKGKTRIRERDTYLKTPKRDDEDDSWKDHAGRELLALNERGDKATKTKEKLERRDGGGTCEWAPVGGNTVRRGGLIRIIEEGKGNRLTGGKFAACRREQKSTGIE